MILEGVGSGYFGCGQLSAVLAVSMWPNSPPPIYWNQASISIIPKRFLRTLLQYWCCLASPCPTCYHRWSRVLCVGTAFHLATPIHYTVWLWREMQQSYSIPWPFCRRWLLHITGARWLPVGRFRRWFTFFLAVFSESSKNWQRVISLEMPQTMYNSEVGRTFPFRVEHCCRSR